MFESVKDEIIRRAKWAAVHHGREIDPTGSYGGPKGVYSLKLNGDGIDISVFWVGFQKNLRISAMVYHADGSYPDSLSIVNTREDDAGEFESWHDESLNLILVERLRRLMVLDDVAGVGDQG